MKEFDLASDIQQLLVMLALSPFIKIELDKGSGLF